MPNTPSLRSGQKSPVSAQAREVGPRGRLGKEVTIVKGKTVPPTPKPGMSFKVVDLTKNKSGKP